jgi:hypothetical protein
MQRDCGHRGPPFSTNIEKCPVEHFVPAADPYFEFLEIDAHAVMR